MINKLKEKRFFANMMTQDELSVLSGIERSRISRIENGYIQPSKEEKKILAQALNSTVKEIFPGN